MDSGNAARDNRRGYIIGMVLFIFAIPVLGFIAAALSPEGQVIQSAAPAPAP